MGTVWPVMASQELLTVLDRRGLADPAADLPRPGIAGDEPTAAVRTIIEDVRARGDAALRELTRRFDGPELDRIDVPAEELDDGHTVQAPVGTFRANDFGLHDMHGNVREWCQDDWHSDYTGGPPTDGSPWGDGTAWSHVIRGGSWSNSAKYCRSSYRGGNGQTNYHDIGFRLARGQ